MKTKASKSLIYHGTTSSTSDVLCRERRSHLSSTGRVHVGTHDASEQVLPDNWLESAVVSTAAIFYRFHRLTALRGYSGPSRFRTNAGHHRRQHLHRRHGFTGVGVRDPRRSEGEGDTRYESRLASSLQCARSLQCDKHATVDCHVLVVCLSHLSSEMEFPREVKKAETTAALKRLANTFGEQKATTTGFEPEIPAFLVNPVEEKMDEPNDVEPFNDPM